MEIKLVWFAMIKRWYVYADPAMEPLVIEKLSDLEAALEAAGVILPGKGETK